jgi:hypothetical protein
MHDRRSDSATQKRPIFTHYVGLSALPLVRIQSRARDETRADGRTRRARNEKGQVCMTKKTLLIGALSAAFAFGLVVTAAHARTSDLAGKDGGIELGKDAGKTGLTGKDGGAVELGKDGGAVEVGKDGGIHTLVGKDGGARERGKDAGASE